MVFNICLFLTPLQHQTPLNFLVLKNILFLVLLLVTTLVRADLPLLSVQRQGTNLVVDWTTNSPCYVLEFTRNLASSTWTPYTDAPSAVNEHYRVTFGADTQSLYLRLHRSPHLLRRRRSL